MRRRRERRGADSGTSGVGEHVGKRGGCMIHDQTDAATPSAGSPPPRWLTFAHHAVQALLKLGVPVGPLELLTVTGRRSGLPRTVPVTPMAIDGTRYLHAYLHANWVGN